jgi:hypothetical protein
MRRNLGEIGLRRKRRARDPMAVYDRLPRPLRGWLAGAALPWSPQSALRIWQKCRAKGLSEAETLAALCAAESRTLARARITS